MNDKSDLEAALRSSANAPARTPDRAFVEALEQRLLASTPEHAVVPMKRRARRLGVATGVAIVCTVAGVAAAAGIVATQPFADDSAGPAVSATLETTSVVPDTTDPSTVTTATMVVDTTIVEGTTVAVAEPTSTAPVTAPPTTVASTVPVVPPPTSPAATTTTEVQVPATLTITCAANGTSVDCSWSGAVPPGGVTYAVLRGDLSSGGPGRVFFVPLGTTSWTDPMAVAGVQYSYLVHVFDASNHSLGHSTGVVINCC